MDIEQGYSERYEQALRLAATAYRHQNRKGGDLPYISHPVHVSVILLRYGFSTDVAIAGLLHDVVEDQGVDLSEIEKRFGPQVAALSEHKTDDQGVKRPWEARKQEALGHMREACPEVVAVKAADTLHNARAPGSQPQSHLDLSRSPSTDIYCGWCDQDGKWSPSSRCTGRDHRLRFKWHLRYFWHVHADGIVLPITK
jgi:(p)ppGpp synthase/HD superfamily hydrolase